MQSADAGAILSSIEITCLLGQSCPSVTTTHYINSTRCKMICWVTRIELYTIHHRIHCCRIISSLHSTRLLLSASPEVQYIHSMRTRQVKMLWTVVTLKQFNAHFHRISMELWFASASALFTTSSTTTRRGTSTLVFRERSIDPALVTHSPA